MIFQINKSKQSINKINLTGTVVFVYKKQQYVRIIRPIRLLSSRNILPACLINWSRDLIIGGHFKAQKTIYPETLPL